MKFFTMAMTGLVLVGMTSLAMANPATLPAHPGYPSKGEYAYDTGQQNLTTSQSLREAAKSGDTNMRVNVKSDQPVKEGTRMPKK